MDAQKYMLHCLKLAQKASDEDEVPIGAAVVDPESGEIVSEAYNLSEHKLDATAHAETLAIRRACEKLGVNRLRGLDLYVTLEPCQMCAGAIVQARIKKVYIGCMNPKAGCAGSIMNLLQVDKFNHQVEIEKGILEEECSSLLKDFFRNLRKS